MIIRNLHASVFSLTNTTQYKAKQTKQNKLQDDVKFQVILLWLFYDTCQPTRKEVSFATNTTQYKAKQTKQNKLQDDVKFQVILLWLFYDTCQPTRKEVSFAPQAMPRLVS